jgi:hypothetical protein
VAHKFDELRLTVARQLSDDGVRRYWVWIRRGTATVVHLYEASCAKDAERQAREELEAFEEMAARI